MAKCLFDLKIQNNPIDLYKMFIRLELDGFLSFV